MKKLLSLILLCYLTQGSSQGYISFPDSNAIWVNRLFVNESGWPDPWSTEHLVDINNYTVNGQDTLIASVAYTKLTLTTGEYQGALRDNQGQVYFVPKDSSSEFLLYDFTVSVGDTIPYPLAAWSEYDTLYVSEIDSALTGGQYRTMIHFEDCPDFWIEGIGCSSGLLIDPAVNNNISGSYLVLHCFSYTDTTFIYMGYPFYQAGTCSLDYVSVPLPNNFAQVVVFPNPGSGTFAICHPESVTFHDIFVTNQLGQKIECGIEILADQWLVSMDGFPSGIYFVRITSNQGDFIRKIVKE